MKKPVNRIECPSLAITATLAEPHLLRDLIEELAERRNSTGELDQQLQSGWLAMETSSLEAHVSGDKKLSTQTDMIKIPFTTCFLFTCIKTKGKYYNLEWVRSLS